MPRVQARGVEVRLAGGNTGGAVRVGDTVRRTAGPWTEAVHALLRHLHSVGFDRCPLPLGFDDQGREVLRFLPGRTVGDAKPWPAWVHSDDALRETATWLREYHEAAASFVPPSGAVWRGDAPVGPVTLICHNDAAPYNAAWNDRGLVGFFDWDFAGPGTPEWDLAFTASAWVPLHARSVVAEEGFTDFGDRWRRLSLFLDTYGWAGQPQQLLVVLRERLVTHIEGIERRAAAGDVMFQKLAAGGTVDRIRVALHELAVDFT